MAWLWVNCYVTRSFGARHRTYELSETAKSIEWSREDTTGMMIMNVTCVTFCLTLYILLIPRLT